MCFPNTPKRSTRLRSARGIVFLTVDEVRSYHDDILLPGQLAGEDKAKLEGAVSRVEAQVAYLQLSDDVLEIAAAYAVNISRAHAFTDGNKRTALLSMLMFLEHHGYDVDVDPYALADKMEACAAGTVTDQELWKFIFDHLSPYDPPV